MQTVLVVLLFVAPGTAIIFHFGGRRVFLELDFFKAVLLSLAYTVPFFILIFLGFVATGSDSTSDGELFEHFALGAVFTGLILYFSLGIAYIAELSFKVTTIMSMVLTVAFVLVMIIRAKFKQ